MRVEREEEIDELEANAGRAAGEARDLQGEHEADRRGVEEGAGPGGVRQDDVGLQPLELVGGDARLREAAEPGVDAVGRFAVGQDARDRGRGRRDGGPRGRRERDRDPLARDRAQRPEGERRRAECDGHQSGRSIGRSSPCARAQAIAAS